MTSDEGADTPDVSLVKEAPVQPSEIEFFGLPGIGKTSVANYVAEGLTQLGMKILSSQDEISDDASKFRKHCARARLILSALPDLPAWRHAPAPSLRAQNQGIKSRSKAIYNALTLAALRVKADRSGSILLYDQGTAQAAWSILNFSICEINCADHLLPERNWAPLIIFLEAPLDVVAERLDGRESRHSRMQQPSADWLRAKEAETSVLNSLSRMASEGKLHLKTYSTEGVSPKKLAEKIVDDIMSLQMQPT